MRSSSREPITEILDFGGCAVDCGSSSSGSSTLGNSGASTSSTGAGNVAATNTRSPANEVSEEASALETALNDLGLDIWAEGFEEDDTEEGSGGIDNGSPAASSASSSSEGANTVARSGSSRTNSPPTQKVTSLRGAGARVLRSLHTTYRSFLRVLARTVAMPVVALARGTPPPPRLPADGPLPPMPRHPELAPLASMVTLVLVQDCGESLGFPSIDKRYTMKIVASSTALASSPSATAKTKGKSKASASSSAASPSAAAAAPVAAAGMGLSLPLALTDGNDADVSGAAAITSAVSARLQGALELIGSSLFDERRDGRELLNPVLAVNFHRTGGTQTLVYLVNTALNLTLQSELQRYHQVNHRTSAPLPKSAIEATQPARPSAAVLTAGLNLLARLASRPHLLARVGSSSGNPSRVYDYSISSSIVKSSNSGNFYGEGGCSVPTSDKGAPFSAPLFAASFHADLAMALLPLLQASPTPEANAGAAASSASSPCLLGLLPVESLASLLSLVRHLLASLALASTIDPETVYGDASSGSSGDNSGRDPSSSSVSAVAAALASARSAGGRAATFMEHLRRRGITADTSDPNNRITVAARAHEARLMEQSAAASGGGGSGRSAAAAGGSSGGGGASATSSIDGLTNATARLRAAALARAAFVPDPATVANLVAMGFTRAHAEEAMHTLSTNHSNILVDYMLSHPYTGRPIARAPPPLPAPAAAVADDPFDNIPIQAAAAAAVAAAAPAPPSAALEAALASPEAPTPSAAETAAATATGALEGAASATAATGATPPSTEQATGANASTLTFGSSQLERLPTSGGSSSPSLPSTSAGEGSSAMEVDAADPSASASAATASSSTTIAEVPDAAATAASSRARTSRPTRRAAASATPAAATSTAPSDASGASNDSGEGGGSENGPASSSSSSSSSRFRSSSRLRVPVAAVGSGSDGTRASSSSSAPTGAAGAEGTSSSSSSRNDPEKPASGETGKPATGSEAKKKAASSTTEQDAQRKADAAAIVARAKEARQALVQCCADFGLSLVLGPRPFLPRLPPTPLARRLSLASAAEIAGSQVSFAAAEYLGELCRGGFVPLESLIATLGVLARRTAGVVLGRPELASSSSTTATTSTSSSSSSSSGASSSEPAEPMDVDDAGAPKSAKRSRGSKGKAAAKTPPSPAAKATAPKSTQSDAKAPRQLESPEAAAERLLLGADASERIGNGAAANSDAMSKEEATAAASRQLFGVLHVLVILLRQPAASAAPPPRASKATPSSSAPSTSRRSSTGGGASSTAAVGSGESGPVIGSSASSSSSSGEIGDSSGAVPVSSAAIASSASSSGSSEVTAEPTPANTSSSSSTGSSSSSSGGGDSRRKNSSGNKKNGVLSDKGLRSKAVSLAPILVDLLGLVAQRAAAASAAASASGATVEASRKGSGGSHSLQDRTWPTWTAPVLLLLELLATPLVPEDDRSTVPVASSSVPKESSDAPVAGLPASTEAKSEASPSSSSTEAATASAVPSNTSSGNDHGHVPALEVLLSPSDGAACLDHLLSLWTSAQGPPAHEAGALGNNRRSNSSNSSGSPRRCRPEVSSAAAHGKKAAASSGAGVAGGGAATGDSPAFCMPPSLAHGALELCKRLVRQPLLAQRFIAASGPSRLLSLGGGAAFLGRTYLVAATLRLSLEAAPALLRAALEAEVMCFGGVLIETYFTFRPTLHS